MDRADKEPSLGQCVHLPLTNHSLRVLSAAVGHIMLEPVELDDDPSINQDIHFKVVY